MATTQTERPALLNQREAAALLGISQRTMYRLLAAGSLEPVVIAGLGHPRYRRADVDALVRDGRAP